MIIYSTNMNSGDKDLGAFRSSEEAIKFLEEAAREEGYSVEEIEDITAHAEANFDDGEPYSVELGHTNYFDFKPIPGMNVKVIVESGVVQDVLYSSDLINIEIEDRD